MKEIQDMFSLMKIMLKQKEKVLEYILAVASFKLDLT